MNRSCKKIKRMASVLFALFLLISGITVFPARVYADGWLDYAQVLTLGTAVNGSIKIGDYYGRTEYPNYNVGYYWHIYRFSMPKDGMLNMYIESAASDYLDYPQTYYYQLTGFAIFSGTNPDFLIWRSRDGENEIAKNYSASRGMYYGSVKIALKQGEYYFTIRSRDTVSTPYTLTLSYSEPLINVSSITLNPSQMTLVAGNQMKISATVLPDNATDKTVVWKSTNPSVATVDNSGMVTAVSNGTADISASSADGEVTASCTVTVGTGGGGGASLQRQKILAKSLKVKYGKKPFYLQASASGDGILTYQSGNTGVADISSNGRVTVKNYGSATITIRASQTAKYKAAESKITITVIPKQTALSKVSAIGRRRLKIKWKKAANIAGYELYVSETSNFSSRTFRRVCGKTKTNMVLAGLKAGKTYYVRIRTYVNAGGKKYSSKFGKPKAVKIR